MAGGCARKLDYSSLSSLLNESGLVEQSASASLIRYPDAIEASLPQQDARVTATVDFLYSFGDDATRFGEISATHAVSDIYASLSYPCLGTLALGITWSDLRSGRAHEIVRGVTAALAREGAALAGGHTVLSAETFTSITVIGEPSGPEVLCSADVGDYVLTSKPIGVGLALTALQLGVAGPRDVRDAYDSMLRSNGAAAACIVKTMRSNPGSVKGVTDVSGFGFLAALHNVATGVHLRLDFGAVPVLGGSDRWLAAQAVSGLGDKNMATTDQFTHYPLRARIGRMRALLNDPQTSGGLVVLATREAGKELEQSGGFVRVGEVHALRNHTVIEVVDSRDPTSVPAPEPYGGGPD